MILTAPISDRPAACTKCAAHAESLKWCATVAAPCENLRHGFGDKNKTTTVAVSKDGPHQSESESEDDDGDGEATATGGSTTDGAGSESESEDDDDDEDEEATATGASTTDGAGSEEDEVTPVPPPRPLPRAGRLSLGLTSLRSSSSVPATSATCEEVGTRSKTSSMFVHFAV